MMSDLVRDDVGLGEVTGGAEALFEIAVESQVDVDLLIERAIEGTHGRLGKPAVGLHGVGEEHELGVPVAFATLGKPRMPGTLDIIEDDYFRPVKRSELVNDSLEGAVAKLRDRFSHYLDPATYRRFLDDSSGEFSGVGMEVSEVPEGAVARHLFADLHRGRFRRAGISTEYSDAEMTTVLPTSRTTAHRPRGCQRAGQLGPRRRGWPSLVGSGAPTCRRGDG